MVKGYFLFIFYNGGGVGSKGKKIRMEEGKKNVEVI